MMISVTGMQISQSYEVDLLPVAGARSLCKTKKALNPSQVLLDYKTE